MITSNVSSNVNAAIDYYIKGLSNPDYHSKDAMVTYWSGKSAERLQLFGEVEGKDFISVVKNLDPNTGEKLKPRNRKNARIATDLTTSLGKDLSVLKAMTKDPEVRQDIQDAHINANNKMLKEAEKMMQTRDHIGLATKDVFTGNMMTSSYLHDTSRPVDGIAMPQSHIHNLVKNITWFEDKNRFQAAQMGEIMKNLPYLQAFFHNELAKELIEKGYPLVRENGHYHLKGFSREGIEAFSPRTKQIEAFCEANNITNPKIKGEIGAKLRENKKNALPTEQVEAYWNKIIPESDRYVVNNIRNDDSGTQYISAREALSHALEHELENNSTVNEKRLLATALTYGVGSVSLDELRSEYEVQGVMVGTDTKCQTLVTTRRIYQQEQRMIAYVRSGRGMNHALTTIDYKIPDFFNKDQREAVQHIWASGDSVTILQGKAGTGKTTLMKTAVEGIEQEGKKVFALAPTNAATNMLKEDEFANTNTLARFLKDEKLQESAKGQVVWLDEAGMVGTQDMSKLFDIASDNGVRVILTGDTTQHHSVGRGDAMRLIAEKGQINIAEVGDIRRQKPQLYKKAVSWLSKGAINEGFGQLDKMGAIKEINDENRYKELSKDYVDAVKKGMSALVVSPTHAEKDKVTHEVRTALKASGKIDTDDERLFTKYKTIHLSTAQKKDIRSYLEGQHIQVNQNMMGFTKGDRLKVLRTTFNKLKVERENGEIVELDINNAKRFNLYEKETLELAKGDMIRITKGGTSEIYGNKTRFDNGKRYKVEGFTEHGDIRLSNGSVISKYYGNIDNGIVSTSHSSQGQTVDKVIIANSSTSFGKATNLEQFYVSASRGRVEVTVYTDNKDQLLQQVQKTSERLSATELMEERHGFWEGKSKQAIDYYRKMQEHLRRHEEPDRDIGLSH